MINLKKIGSLAAFTNGAVNILIMIVVFGFIGMTALIDKDKLMEIARLNPTPIILQDFLKVISALIALILINVLYQHLKNTSPQIMKVAKVFGYLSVFCLFANAGLSFFLISKTEILGEITLDSINWFNGIIGLLGMGVVFLNGVWYLLISWTALKSNQLPKPLCYLGLAMGGLSLTPPFGILVLFLNIFWSFLLGKVLIKK
jgi:predicted membrane channel-forming protein YqfA (hemolysin III family)